jgi:hypothetical protein
LIGGSGLVIITAPFPGWDSLDPLILIAATLAQTLDPQGRLKGAETKF